MNDWLTSVLEAARQGLDVQASAWPQDAELMPGDFDLVRRGDRLEWVDPPDLLDEGGLAAALPDLAIKVLDVVDSTNTRMMTEAARGSIANQLLLAELQTGGRGRRGRRWLSPYARNLSASLGVTLNRPLAELGGLSLVVGLGLAGALEELGVSQPMLKWPNDVLVGDRKICGILIELVPGPGAAQAVIGMGVNVSLRDGEIVKIGQPVTDLRRCGAMLSRTELVIALVQSVRRYLQRFAEQGFAGFIDTFNSVHRYHSETCVVHIGEQRVEGVVAGVGPHGELLLDTAGGRQALSAGEVSLRAAPQP